MVSLMEVYVCALCGNVVEVVGAGKGRLVCCGDEMALQTPKDQDEGKEKHLPVVEITDCGVKVQVGDTPHPMEDKHYIMWIELTVKTKECGEETTIKYLSPGDKPEVCFTTSGEVVRVRSYCNIHGLWQVTP
jgi:superoxide reductase